MSCTHRDLKLENILLDKNENVKLCDFGFTREYEGKLSYLQTFCGTVCYSAPEMLKGEKYAAEKVDVWSLGIILFALLTGELPFDDDDDLVTKHKILSSEPKYPDGLPPDAKHLLVQMLSKRPLLRPALTDILTNAFLAEYAPQQQAILKIARPVSFTTDIEKATLERMRSAGINIDRVIESVLAQRCDALSGWWALLIEREEKKEQRRERKRREKDAETKNVWRLSAASSRLDRLTPTLKEVDERAPASPTLHATNSRGRGSRRSTTRKLQVYPATRHHSHFSHIFKPSLSYQSFPKALRLFLLVRLCRLRRSKRTLYETARAARLVEDPLLHRKKGDAQAEVRCSSLQAIPTC